MALTAVQLLTEIAAAEAKTWDATIAANADGTSDFAEREKFHIVTKANEALRWWHKEKARKFAWPETVDSGMVTVTDGLIPKASLGEGSWCLLATADPRPFGASYRWVKTLVSEDGIHPLCTETSLFAFFRTACPQITYLASDSYATPSNIPNVCLQPVAMYANGRRLMSQGQFKEGAARVQQAEDLFETRQAQLLNSGLVWNVPESIAIE